MALRITADDFGLSPEANAAILRVAPRLSGVSVMVHRNAALDELDALRRTGVPLGLHLVLTRERPLTCGFDEGMPRTWLHALRMLSLRPATRTAFGYEMAAQIARFSALRLPMSFINSHEHVHLLPPIWKLLAPLLPRHVEVRSALGQRPRHLGQLALTVAARVCWALKPLPNPMSSAIGVASRLDETTLPNWLREAGRVRGSSLPELVVHPVEDQLESLWAKAA